MSAFFDSGKLYMNKLVTIGRRGETLKNLTMTGPILKARVHD